LLAIFEKIIIFIASKTNRKRRKIMKKKIVGMMMAAAMTLSLVACGSGESTSGGSSDSSAAEGDESISGTITVWEHDYSFEDSLEQIIEGFNEAYPNVQVDYEIKADGDYYSLLQTAIQSGSGPDLFWTNGTATSNMPDLVSNGACEDLKDQVDYSFISDSAMDLATIDDGVYSVPWMTMDTRTVFYNKDMFEENGWEIPTTFSEFEELLATIKATGITPISMAHDSWCMLFAYEPVLAGYDADYTAGLSDYTSKADGDAAREALQKMVDWANNGYFGDNWTGVIDNSAQILAFTTGNAAMDIAGSWDAATISENNPDLNYGAFAIPSEDGTTGLVGTSANGFSVNSASANMDAAVAFANFCASKEAQTIWVQSQGAVSGSSEIEASTEIAQEISESGAGTTYRSWQNVLSSYSSSGNASTVWDSDFMKVFDGNLTVDELMDEIAAEMD
jgi:raffinose/stachyose/melibiose transport system substrate-binding protein